VLRWQDITPQWRPAAPAVWRRSRPDAYRLLDLRAGRYSTSMKLAFELPPPQAQRLCAEAERLGLAPEDLVRAAVTDLLAAPDPEFQAIASRIVATNQELYRRLA
jgi:hypothetical protein